MEAARLTVGRVTHAAGAAEGSADRWPDEVSLSDLEPLFVCKVCGHRGADVSPDYAAGG
ncbi:MAG: hypothetical protein Q7N95_06565 [Alphaproteobacteria bacterium]|nr:hypothetical protein [Alphaproteobacteria bacterium]